MKKIVFCVYDESELKAWIDILAEYDIDWYMDVVRNKRNPDKKCYRIKTNMNSEVYDILCHQTYMQYYNYVCCV